MPTFSLNVRVCVYSSEHMLHVPGAISKCERGLFPQRVTLCEAQDTEGSFLGREFSPPSKPGGALLAPGSRNATSGPLDGLSHGEHISGLNSPCSCGPSRLLRVTFCSVENTAQNGVGSPCGCSDPGTGLQRWRLSLAWGNCSFSVTLQALVPTDCSFLRVSAPCFWGPGF